MPESCHNSLWAGNNRSGNYSKPKNWPEPVILSGVKNLSRRAEILRFTQNDRPEGMFQSLSLIRPASVSSRKAFIATYGVATL